MGQECFGITSMECLQQLQISILCSELKGIDDSVVDVKQFPADFINIILFETYKINRQYNPIQGDAPFELFISGGVDSSIVASIVAKLIKTGQIDFSKRGKRKVYSFCIGFEASPDLHFAKKMPDFQQHQYKILKLPFGNINILNSKLLSYNYLKFLKNNSVNIQTQLLFLTEMFQQSEATLGFNRNQTENQPDTQRESSQQQNPFPQQQFLTDEQKSVGNLNPYVFTSYNMPKINCYNHFGQTITNFCKSQECRLPLCPECVKEHVNEHSEFKTYPKLECLENILTQVHSDICQQANQIINAQYNIEKSRAQAYSQTTFTVEKLKEAKKRIVNVIEQYFDTLENELENKQKKNYENFKRDADALMIALKARQGAYINFLDKLQQPECMYSLLPYLASPSKEDNQQYIQIANKFTSRFKEIQSEITFDSNKSAQLSAHIAEVVGVIHQDLTEYLDIHKLAPPEIVKSKALTLKSQNNQQQKKTQSPTQQYRNFSKTLLIQENKDQEFIKHNPNLEQTVRYQQINPQSIQMQQFQSPSNFNSMNKNYPSFAQQQPQYYSNQPQYQPQNQQRYQQQVPQQQYLQYDQNAQYQNTINPIQKFY